MSKEIFRRQALDRHAAPSVAPSEPLDIAGRTFALLWATVAALALVLGALTWLVVGAAA